MVKAKIETGHKKNSLWCVCPHCNNTVFAFEWATNSSDPIKQGNDVICVCSICTKEFIVHIESGVEIEKYCNVITSAAISNEDLIKMYREKIKQLEKAIYSLYVTAITIIPPNRKTMQLVDEINKASSIIRSAKEIKNREENN